MIFLIERITGMILKKKLQVAKKYKMIHLVNLVILLEKPIHQLKTTISEILILILSQQTTSVK